MLKFRETPLQDLWDQTHPDTPAPIELGEFRNWQCVFGSEIVGYCTGNAKTGEITNLAVVPKHRRQGIGRKLLFLVVEAFRGEGTTKIWLAAPPTPNSPAFHFYRATGWVRTGDRTDDGHEILQFPADRAIQVGSPVAE